MVEVLLISDDQFVIESIKQHADDEVRIVTARTYAEGISKVALGIPFVAVAVSCCLRAPSLLNASDVIEQIRVYRPDVPILLFSEHHSCAKRLGSDDVTLDFPHGGRSNALRRILEEAAVA